eukprot:1618986-Prymnesium_polylepis.1
MLLIGKVQLPGGSTIFGGAAGADTVTDVARDPRQKRESSCSPHWVWERGAADAMGVEAAGRAGSGVEALASAVGACALR